ncbi:hypothetical protein EMPS_01135 [Entomortierella parvispora]|uniref:NAD(P)-binding domain-containing protein n=1 Tax=Entomortierella parvispora TaxID=205924 RepID=A0A9P3H2A2_9FUNG|nr:hypothetical protein EMPS_01135 [Entomortierella parvispora]
MAAETRRPRDLHVHHAHPTIAPEYLYNSPSPTSPSLSPPSSASSVSSSSSHIHNIAIERSLFGELDHFQQRPVPASLAEQRKEARIAQRQRREQIVLKLQREQIEAQEKAKAEKLEKQQAKMERKQKRAELAAACPDLDLPDREQQRYRLQDSQPSPLPDFATSSQHNKSLQQRSLPIHPFTPQPDVQYHSSQYYHVDGVVYQHSHKDPLGQPQHDAHSSASSTTSTASRSSRSTPDRLRSLSLKGTHKSMYDLRPLQGPSSPTVPSVYYEQQSPFHPHHYDQHSPQDHYYLSGYESDENASSRSHGWDSLMDTLHSPTVSSPSDDSWDSRDEPELDLMDTMSSLTMSHNNGSGNGKYLLVLGANGRTGIELVKQGLERNYRVTAFVRDDKVLLEDSSLRKNQNLLIVRGSPTSQADLDRCVEGQDVVVNVIGARLMANDTTISSHSQVILNNAMKKHGVRRLIVVTSYGCLGLRNYLISTRRLFSRVFMTGILKDKVLQEDIIQRDSEHLDWTIVRPITLKDGDLSEKYWVSSEALPKTNKVKVLTRKDLAHYILTIINQKQQHQMIRSIAGKPKPSKPNPFCPFERKKMELTRQQELELEKQMTKTKTF